MPEASELAEAYWETCDEPGLSGPTLTFAQTVPGFG